jgi:hypothetical protein
MAGHRIVMEKNAIMRFHRVTNDRGDQTRPDERTGAMAQIVAARPVVYTVTTVIEWMTSEATFSAQECFEQHLCT